MRWGWICLAWLSALATARAAADDGLLMVFRDKPPYSYVENGTQKGFLLERTRRILQAAGLRAEFQDMPPKRIFQELQANQERICSFGWYKIPERERFASFTLPIHQDRPHVVLFGPRMADSPRFASLAELMAAGALTLAVADGVSYGPELDRLIAAFPGKVDRGLVSPLQVAKKLASRRADFMFIDQEDYEYLLATDAGFRAEALKRVEFPDLPPGLKRYILCTRQVDESTIARMNAAIARLTADKGTP